MGKTNEKPKILAFFEIGSGLLVVIGVLGLFSWFTYETAQLKILRQEITDNMEAYEAVADDLQETYKKLHTPLEQVVDLHKKFLSFEVVERTSYGRREETIIRGAGNVFFHETFTDYQLGDLPEEWGTGLGVVGNAQSRYLHGISETSGKVRREIPFPQNFAFSFLIHGISKVKWKFVLVDANGKTLEIRRWEWMDLNLTGAEDVDLRNVMEKNTWHIVKLEVWGKTFKLSVDENFASSSRLSGYKNFVRINMIANPWNDLYLDEFYGVDLGEEVRPKR